MCGFKPLSQNQSDLKSADEPTRHAGLVSFQEAMHTMKSSCLTCVLDGVELGIATAAIDQLAEMELMPIPLARPWVGGVAEYRGEPYVCIRLSAIDQTTRESFTKKIILIKESKVGFIIDGTRQVQSLDVHRDLIYQVKGWCNPPGWILKASNEMGRTVACIDIDPIARFVTNSNVGVGMK